jgi:23S rRNA (cytidine1920-2'-O)/16S rRNA (cytidine1409-2'-O)-methyltransferase
MRLDNYLFEKKIAQSRNKASEMIKNREVFVDEKLITKPSFEVDETNVIRLSPNKTYVSRAGYKLEGFLKESFLKIEGLTCLDIGSSTGGFVEVLLGLNAKKVVGVDVGKDQLHPSLRDIKNLELFEQMDIRKFYPGETFELVTCDVSFIAIEHILEDINRLANEYIIILFKPQFEVGKDIKRTKTGVVKDQKAIQRAINEFEAKAFSLGWELLEKRDSILSGKEGNVETFFCFKKR